MNEIIANDMDKLIAYKSNVKRISSREVAEMMEMEHSKLLRKIHGINLAFNQAKIGFDKYWIESMYKDGKGEMRKEFKVSLLGCEFLANKLTGLKGTVFTDKYITRFHEMESAIKGKQLGSLGILKLQLQVMEEQGQQIQEVKTDLESFKVDIPLFGVECDDLQKIIRAKGTQVLGGKESVAYRNKNLRARVYRDIQREIKRQFGVRSYKAIKRKDLATAKDIASNYSLPYALKLEVTECNNLV